MATRPAKKAGHWYQGIPDDLETELKGYLADVPSTVDGRQLPIAGARVIIAP